MNKYIGIMAVMLSSFSGLLIAQTPESLSENNSGALLNAEERNISEEMVRQETEAEAAADSLATYDILDDIIVEAVRPIVKTDGATTTYSVDEDTSAKGQSLLDVLRRVPGVTVDGQDNIKVQGKSDFKIFLNGREDPMLSQNAAEILKAMPSSAVSRIEVMTDPGAKYDAEGTAGILNLVTERKQTKDGYSGNITAGVSTMDYNAGGYVMSRMNKVLLSANLMYAGNDGLSRTQHNEYSSEYKSTGDKIVQTLNQKPNFRFGQGGYKLSWEPDAANLFTTSLDINVMKASLNNNAQHTLMYDSAGAIQWSYISAISAAIDRKSMNADASYQHCFDEQGHLIVASYSFNYADNNIDYETICESRKGIDNPLGENSLSSNITRQHTAQIDYTNPFKSDTHKLEAGLKGIFRRNSAFGTRDIAMTDMSEYLPVPDDYTNLSQFQDILAAYGSYSFTTEVWNIRAGVRYEHTRMGIKNHIENGSKFTTRLDDVVPNASVTYSFGPARNLRLAYSMRISRPTIDQVNPFREEVGYRVEVGNPQLTSERLNNISLSYTSFGRVLGGTFGVEYGNTANTIERVVTLDGLYTVTSYMNTGTSQNLRFNGFLNWTIINDMSLSASGSLTYKNLKAPSLKTSASGWSGDVSANWNWRLKGIANIGAFGGWGSPTVMLQAKSFSWYYYGISVGRDFLKDKSLSVNLILSDFIKPVKTFKFIQNTEDVRTVNKFRNNNWRVGVSVTWNFGSLRERVKETAADLSTEDTKTVSGNNGQGGGIRL